MERQNLNNELMNKGKDSVKVCYHTGRAFSKFLPFLAATCQLSIEFDINRLVMLL